MNTNDQPTRGRPSILIIDDNRPTLELYAGALHRDYQVFTCADSDDAAALLAVQPMQLVILEPTVAGSQGWTFLQEIVRSYRLPVIVCSGLEDRKSGLAAGAAAYLVKPVLPTTLLEVLKGILN
ncbi:MAG TPA: response regulator [Phototrophicaceae bacterium]|nr:response regulator [Phototrophicaceae bacterium]